MTTDHHRGGTDDIPITESRMLPPDPRVMETIGLNHALETAIADLVDNSIDAHASRVLIRFVRSGSRLVRLYVVDDGDGMDDGMIDVAMTVGGRREYTESDLGHFGIGLKAASLGQADALTVLSRRNACSVGRRWVVDKASKSFECDVVDPTFAASTLDQRWEFLEVASGTAVRWDGVRGFPSARSAQVTERYLEEAVLRLRHHLGLVFRGCPGLRGTWVTVLLV